MFNFEKLKLNFFKIKLIWDINIKKDVKAEYGISLILKGFRDIIKFWKRGING